MLLLAAVALLAVGGGLYLAGFHSAANAVWAADTLVGIVPAGWWVIDAARHRRLGVDVLAVLALVGTLVVGEYLAGAVITVMVASGRTLEARAAAHARRELHALLAHVPRMVHRYDNGVLRRHPSTTSCAATCCSSSLARSSPSTDAWSPRRRCSTRARSTGEPLPVEHAAGDAVRSGVVNAGGPFDLRAATSAADSTYAGIVRLVSEAEASSAPFVRLADRYAGVFLGVAVALAGAAWALSGDLERAVAVLVVATPCPLILAAPVAIVSGLSRAAGAVSS